MSQVQVGNIVRELRTSAGLTQMELAVASGLTIRSIQRIENGKTIPRGDSLKRIATALNIPVESLTSIPFLEKVESRNIENGNLEVPGAVILSAFSFLIHPVLGIIFPLMLWLIFRKKIDGVHEIGLRVLRLEIYWCLILACLNLYLLVKKLSHWNLPIPGNIKVFAMLNIGLYIINALVLVIYFVRWMSARKKSMIEFEL